GCRGRCRSRCQESMSGVDARSRLVQGQEVRAAGSQGRKEARIAGARNQQQRMAVTRGQFADSSQPLSCKLRERGRVGAGQDVDKPARRLLPDRARELECSCQGAACPPWVRGVTTMTLIPEDGLGWLVALLLDGRDYY